MSGIGFLNLLGGTEGSVPPFFGNRRQLTLNTDKTKGSGPAQPQSLLVR